MSDYLKRLVRRAVPISYSVPEKLTEVRPATSLYRQTNADTYQDFEIEREEADPKLDATRLFPDRSPTPTDNPPAIPVQPVTSLDLLEDSAPQGPLFQSGSDTVREVETASTPDLLDIQPGDFAPGSPPPVIEVLASIQTNSESLMGEQASLQDTPEAIQRLPAGIAPFSGNLPSSPDDRSEAALDDQTRPVDPGSQPAPKIDERVVGQVIELESMPHLEPQIPSPVESGPSGPEFERVEIGSLTIEVLAAPPPPQDMPRAVQITQVEQSAPPRHTRSSKLRFGLRQM